jgi:hypothetical protein
MNFQTLCSDNNIQNGISIDKVRDLLVCGELSKVQKGRKMVAISLAEAETIRRIIHLRNNSTSNWLTSGNTDQFCISLRCFSGGNFITDKSINFIGCEDKQSNSLYLPFTLQSAYEGFRYFNCDMFFNENSLYTLIKCLHNTTKRIRKLFYKSVLICRRRLNKKWRNTPISKIFIIDDQFKMFKQRSFSIRVCHEIAKKGLLLYDAFCKFDYDRNGYLSPGEVWGGFEYLGIPMTPEDVLDFVNAGDLDKDGNLSFREFVDILQDPDKVSDRSHSDVDADNAMETDSAMSSGLPYNGVGDNDDTYIEQLSLQRSKSHTSICSNDFNDDGLSPPSLQRQISLNLIHPKGEDMLHDLQVMMTAQEKEEEEIDDNYEREEEKRVQMALEVIDIVGK